LERGCDGGHDPDCLELAWIYLDGRGVAADRERAVAFFHKACDLASGGGCLQLCLRGESAACHYGETVVGALRTFFSQTDALKRRETTSATRDLELLLVVRWADRDRGVQDAARRRIGEIAKGDADPMRRAAAVAELQPWDEPLLAEIARADTDGEVREAAARNLAELTAGKEAAGKPSQGRATLAAMASKDSDPKVREAAVDQLEDPVLLSRIAKTDKSAEVRQAAVFNKNLKDETLLAEIAIKDGDEGVADVAVDRVASQVLLGRIASNARHESVREGAVQRLEDQAILVEIVEHDSSALVREAAAQRVTDARTLARLALNAADDTVREIAVSSPSLKDEMVLARVAWKDKNLNVCLAAIRRLTDQRSLAEIASTHRDPGVSREEAARRLTDQDLLAKLAKNATEWGVRDIAVLHLEDQELLEEIARTDADSKVRADAAKRLRELQAGRGR
jgi:hypothetical protein